MQIHSVKVLLVWPCSSCPSLDKYSLRLSSGLLYHGWSVNRSSFFLGSSFLKLLYDWLFSLDVVAIFRYALPWISPEPLPLIVPPWEVWILSLIVTWRASFFIFFESRSRKRFKFTFPWVISISSWVWAIVLSFVRRQSYASSCGFVTCSCYWDLLFQKIKIKSKTTKL